MKLNSATMMENNIITNNEGDYYTSCLSCKGIAPITEIKHSLVNFLRIKTECSNCGSLYKEIEVHIDGEVNCISNSCKDKFKDKIEDFKGYPYIPSEFFDSNHFL